VLLFFVIQKLCEPIFLEYFENGDTYEAALALEEIDFGSKRYLVSTRVLSALSET